MQVTLTHQSVKWFYGFFFLVVSLGLGIVFAIKLSKAESKNLESIKTKICNYQDISPGELTLIINLLSKKEERSFTDIDDIREFLCNNSKDYSFPEKNQLAKILGTKDIHKVKEKVKKLTQEWQRKINSHNPDIGINQKTKNLVLKNPKTQKTVETTILFDTFVTK